MVNRWFGKGLIHKDLKATKGYLILTNYRLLFFTIESDQVTLMEGLGLPHAAVMLSLGYPYSKVPIMSL